MKKAFNTMIIALILGSFGSVSYANQPPEMKTKDVVVSVSDVHVPGGFDTNSDVYVVESGMFPNGCYAWKEALVAHPSPFLHEIQTIATVTQGMCIMVLVPFTKEVRLGRFERGTHTLRFLNGDGTYLERKLAIE